MKLDSFVGMVGGKPRFAYYFVGHLERPAEELGTTTIKDEADRLIYLDPHYVLPQADPELYPSNKTFFHCGYPARSIHMSKLDPCLSYGFLIKSKAEFELFKREITEGIKLDGGHPIFHVQDNLEFSSRSLLSIGTQN